MAQELKVCIDLSADSCSVPPPTLESSQLPETPAAGGSDASGLHRFSHCTYVCAHSPIPYRIIKIIKTSLNASIQRVIMKNLDFNIHLI